MNLRNKKVGVIGFNARPIACAAKRLGATVFVSDFWGDLDLPACCDEWVAINVPGYEHVSDVPLARSLVDNFRRRFIECDIEYDIERDIEYDIDYVLVGSGFDDHPEFLADLAAFCEVLTSPAPAIKRARDPMVLKTMAEELGICYPRRATVTDGSSLIAACRSIGFPCVIRRTHSGGGSGVHFILNSSRMEEYLRKNGEPKHPLVVQEYIKGLDASCSVVSTGRRAMVVSLQGQLIGMPSAGRNNDFVYCGNYWPLGVSERIRKRLTEVSKQLCERLGLVGSNGIDYVIRGDEIYLMEVNPRLQGTLEVLEISGETSILKMHMDAFAGKLPTKLPEFRPVVKLIVYAKKRGPCPDLSQFPHTFDLTPTGTVLEPGRPICTIITVSETLEDAYGSAISIARKIQTSY